jgi:polyisoprenoid-binding protein YceI
MVLWVPTGAWAQAYQTQTGKAVFLSDAPLRSFEGVSEKLHGLVDLEQNLLDFYLDLNTLKTGISLRDKHMRDNYLETKKYPFAEFTGKIKESLTERSLPEGQAVKVTATGTFKIHGVARTIDVPGTLTRKGNTLLLQASFKVLLTDHQIEKPSLVGFELADEQVVTITASLLPEKPKP